MSSLFFFNDTATTEIYTLSLHDALPICLAGVGGHHELPLFFQSGQSGKSILSQVPVPPSDRLPMSRRSEEHTSELQSHLNLVCRLLLEKKKIPHLLPRINVSTGYIATAP